MLVISTLLCRYTWVTGKEPLTYYDMNLSAQDHQTFFTGDTQQLKPEDTGEFHTVQVCVCPCLCCSYTVRFQYCGCVCVSQ